MRIPDSRTSTNVNSYLVRIQSVKFRLPFLYRSCKEYNGQRKCRRNNGRPISCRLSKDNTRDGPSYHNTALPDCLYSVLSVGTAVI